MDPIRMKTVKTGWKVRKLSRRETCQFEREKKVEANNSFCQGPVNLAGAVSQTEASFLSSWRIGSVLDIHRLSDICWHYYRREPFPSWVLERRYPASFNVPSVKFLPPYRSFYRFFFLPRFENCATDHIVSGPQLIFIAPLLTTYKEFEKCRNSNYQDSSYILQLFSYGAI